MLDGGPGGINVRFAGDPDCYPDMMASSGETTENDNDDR
jgi:hypothetical protein